jgi:ABC-type sulfate transport system substrate-binding protein
MNENLQNSSTPDRERDRIKDRTKAAILSFIVLTLALALFLGGRTILANDNLPIRLVVYAFSTQEEVLTQGILPAFERKWESENGQELIIESLYGPSGTLAGQINLGAHADVVLFSNERHVSLLKFGKQVNQETQPVVFSCTPIIIVTRPGNPAGIIEIVDLGQPDLQLLHANPRSSGVGEWAILAEYGSGYLPSGDESAAEKQLKDIWNNVKILAPSARAAMTLFEMGAGDALITYEQDAQMAEDRGVALEIVKPTYTINAQHVAVIVDKNVSRVERPVAEAFTQYLISKPGQDIFIRYHQQPADLLSKGVAQSDHYFTVAELGGWSSAYQELILSLWQKGIEPLLVLEPAFMIQKPADQ